MGRGEAADPRTAAVTGRKRFCRDKKGRPGACPDTDKCPVWGWQGRCPSRVDLDAKRHQGPVALSRTGQDSGRDSAGIRASKCAQSRVGHPPSGPDRMGRRKGGRTDGRTQRRPQTFLLLAGQHKAGMRAAGPAPHRGSSRLPGRGDKGSERGQQSRARAHEHTARWRRSPTGSSCPEQSRSPRSCKGTCVQASAHTHTDTHMNNGHMQMHAQAHMHTHRQTHRHL